MKQAMISILLCLISALASTSLYAAMYKWVDENGQTVYSQNPPPAGRGGEIIKAPPPPAEDPEQVRQNLEKKSSEFGERRGERLTVEQDAKKVQEKEAERKKLCEELRKNLETLTTQTLVRSKNEKGETVVLGAEQREAEIKQTRDQIAEFCQ